MLQWPRSLGECGRGASHWASDVLGGAVVGGFIGHHLVAFNRRWRAENESAWMPELGTGGQQLLLTWRF